MKTEERTNGMDEAHILLFYNEAIGKWTASDTSAMNLLRLAPGLGTECREGATDNITLDWHHLEEYGLMKRVVLASDNFLLLSAAPAPSLSF